MQYTNKQIFLSLSQKENLNNILNLQSLSGGKSGAFLYCTVDDKFIVKTITKYEKKVFVNQLMQKYMQRIFEGNSKLVRILGIFKLGASKIYFMLMESIICERGKAIIFDLKGSEYNRFIRDIEDDLNPPVGKVMKEHNFKCLGRKISLSAHERESILSSIKYDVLLLKNMKIMDYSLLLVFYNSNDIPLNRYTERSSENTYFSLGIIDIFQEFTMLKIAEKSVKSIFHDSNQISSANPEVYAYRFLNYLNEIFI